MFNKRYTTYMSLIIIMYNSFKKINLIELLRSEGKKKIKFTC